jgi:hypothetical protein
VHRTSRGGCVALDDHLQGKQECRPSRQMDGLTASA